MSDDVLVPGPTDPPAAYRLELRRSLAPDPAATPLGHGGDAAALLGAAEGHAADLLARGVAGVLCVVAVDTGRVVARRPVWPRGGPWPGLEADSWWGCWPVDPGADPGAVG